MPFNGSGLFGRVYNFVNDAANSINIRADRMDAEMDGIASGLSNCITRDGQGKPVSAMDWNGQNLSNVNALSATSGAFTGAVNGATGTFSGAVTAPTFTGAVNGTTGTFSGAVSGTTATFSGAVNGASGAFSGAVTGASAAVAGAVTAATGAFSGGVTAATPATGNRSTSVATTQMFANEFASSIATSGYQKLPSGLILQWGSLGGAPGGGNSIGFPIAFPTAVLSACANIQAANFNTYSCNIAGITQTQMDVRLTIGNVGTQAGFYWFAIGI